MRPDESLLKKMVLVGMMDLIVKYRTTSVLKESFWFQLSEEISPLDNCHN